MQEACSGQYIAVFLCCSFLLIYFFSSNVVSFRGCRGALLGYLSTFCPFSPFLLRAHRAVSRTFPLHPGCWAAFCPSSHRLCPRHPHRGCGAQPCPEVGMSWFPAQERLQHGFAPYYKSETPPFRTYCKCLGCGKSLITSCTVLGAGKFQVHFLIFCFVSWFLHLKITQSLPVSFEEL